MARISSALPRAINRGEGAVAPAGRVLCTLAAADGLLRARPFMCPSPSRSLIQLKGAGLGFPLS